MPTVEHGTGDVRRLADAQWAAARLAESYAGLPEGVSKAMLLDRFERAAPRLGLHESLVRFIRALVRVTQEQDWSGGIFRPIAWPSNDALGQELQRSRTEVQRLTRSAVQAGLIHMKDSGNGKRYGFRGDRGEIVEAYGFDLSPLAVRWDEFADITAARGVEQARRRRLRQKVSEVRREIRTVAADALAREYEGFDWQLAIAKASGRLPRSPSLEELERLEALHLTLLAEVDAAWLQAREILDNEPRGDSGRAQKEPTKEPAAKATYPAFQEDVVADRPSSDLKRPDGEGLPPVEEEALPLSLVLEATPEIHALLPSPALAEWEDLVQAAYQATTLLGINLSAWREAREVMGRNRAAIAVATILARWQSGEIKSSAGGYLRAMCERERGGALRLLPSLYGLRDRHRPKPRRRD